VGEREKRERECVRVSKSNVRRDRGKCDMKWKLEYCSHPFSSECMWTLFKIAWNLLNKEVSLTFFNVIRHCLLTVKLTSACGVLLSRGLLQYYYKDEKREREICS